MCYFTNIIRLGILFYIILPNKKVDSASTILTCKIFPISVLFFNTTGL